MKNTKRKHPNLQQYISYVLTRPESKRIIKKALDAMSSPSTPTLDYLMKKRG